MKRFIILCLLILIGFSVTASGMEPDSQFSLNTLRFVGIKSVPKDDLAKTLAIQTPPAWKFWMDRPVFSAEDLPDDVLRIKQFYQDRGYYHTIVAYQIEAADDRNAPAGPPSTNVTFTITEGPPVLVEAINITVKPEIEKPAVKDLLKLMPLKPGRIFITAEYRDAKKALLKACGNSGYPFADLTGKATVNTETNSAQVFFRLDPRKQYSFGPLTILPNDAGVKDIVILRAMRFKEGELYDAGKVDESRRNLFSLDMFRLALIKPEAPEPDALSVPMTIQLTPKKSQNIKFGVGYGTEDGFRLKGAWTYRNLWGWAGKTSISAKRSDLIENIQADYIQPYFLDAKNTLRAKTGFERENFDSYTNRKIFGNAGLERNFIKNWTGAVSYNLEVNNLEDIKITDPEELERLSRQNTYVISSLQPGLVYNSTDNTLDPKKGSVVAVSAEWASDLLGSEINFVRPALELKRYQPLSESVTVAGRVRFETIQSDDPASIPIFKRLFLGGSNTVRGYDFHKIPPLDDNSNPLGGLSALNANLELHFPIYRKLTGVIFGDAGLLDPDYFRYNTGDMRYTSGTGIRYKTIVGPLRLDFGYKLNPPESEQKVDRWRIHLSIGQAF
ncbi:MAG: outer membrane protein assembly factor BamA [Desulfobacterales bacterium]|nr:outer membrane protein assembly factor BamA [Desulfobacterales bacterium]